MELEVDFNHAFLLKYQAVPKVMFGVLKECYCSILRLLKGLNAC